MVKTIRGMDDDTWERIKKRSNAENKTLAEYLRSLINKTEKTNADTLLDGKKHLDDKTANKIRERSKDIRDGFTLKP
jgi:chemotaxis signal transduction protein